MLVLVRSFFYIPYVSFSEEMVLTIFLYTRHASFSEEMNKLTSYMKEKGFELCTVFFRVKSLFDTPHAILCWTFLLQFYVQYTSLSGEFFLHTPC